MIIEVLRRSLVGLGFSAIITFAFLTVMVIQDLQFSVYIIWRNVLGGMVMGVYFGTASLVYEIEKWSPLKQTVVHFVLSVSIWLSLAIWMGWVLLFPLLLGIGSFMVIYILFWCGSYLYFKRIESELNSSIKK
ncbi:DUF3021 domain-containing protein [Oceanobacillus senegalensis]|uniref:DUF3021 domain-containing protein n=1 Tax=Oceanobacillus senegalensis TaxID=1936063 RepID=UPI000A314207|nr:DUF3021 domain-containing protein [Oceanobacillus senegalensis]